MKSLKNLFFLVTFFLSMDTVSISENLPVDNSEQKIFIEVLVMELESLDNALKDLTANHPLDIQSIPSQGNILGIMKGSQETTSAAWEFFENLSKEQPNKVLMHPSLMTKNYQMATMKNSITKKIPVAVSGTIHPTVYYQDQNDSAITLNITPSINIEDMDTIAMAIELEFDLQLHSQDGSYNSSFQGSLTASASVKDGDLIILGKNIADSSMKDLCIVMRAHSKA
jgi:type II secretory pathway component GspD/PulD (secretin)